MAIVAFTISTIEESHKSVKTYNYRYETNSQHFKELALLSGIISNLRKYRTKKKHIHHKRRTLFSSTFFQGGELDKLKSCTAAD